MLYNSPSGLVIYWILNNLFSLLKNIVLKTKYPKQITFIFICSLLVLFTTYFWLFQSNTPIWKKEILTAFTVFFISIPFIVKFINKYFSKYIKSTKDSFTNFNTKEQFIIFILTALSLCFLSGLYLPSSVISTSPNEFSFLGTIASPHYYIRSSFFMFFGIFIVWPCCIYFMFDKKVKAILPVFFVSLFFFTLANIFIFKPEYQSISSSFEFSDNSFLYEIPKYFSILPLFVIAVSIAFYFFLFKKNKTFILTIVICSILLAETISSIYNIKQISNTYEAYKKIYTAKKEITEINEVQPLFHLSQNGKNVILIFLDRAVSSFFPYVIDQFPELEKEFDGFTYYPNTLSYGCNTLNGFPPIMGGYEYTTDKIDSRTNELLRDKHNEALKVLPKLFSDSGYNLTIAEPTMANYHWYNDISIYSDFPNTSAINITGDYAKLYKTEKNISYITDDEGKFCNKNIKNFSILQGLYPPLRVMFYNTAMESGNSLMDYFITNYSTLYYLDKLTDVSSKNNNFIFIGNDTPHSPIFLNEDFEIPTDDISITSRNYDSSDSNIIKDYDVNAATILQLGKYFDYLKKNNCYDNTRIVVVADHGCNHSYSDFQDFDDPTIPASYNPLLLFKDFNSTNGIQTDNSLMTNADPLFLLKQGLNLSDKNPFTGKPLIQDDKTNIRVYPLQDGGNNPTYNMDRTQFMTKNPSYEVKENIFVPENWKQFTYTP